MRVGANQSVGTHNLRDFNRLLRSGSAQAVRVGSWALWKTSVDDWHEIVLAIHYDGASSKSIDTSLSGFYHGSPDPNWPSR